MLAYKITGDISFECVEITQEEVINYPAPQWYISETAINWTTHMWVDGNILERPIIPVIEPPEYIPTIQEKTSLINAKYQSKLDTYKDNILSALAVGGANQSTKIATFTVKYNAILVQKNTELEGL